MDTPEAENRIAERLGPFYGLAGLCEWLGENEADVFEKVRNREILAASTVDGVMVFPIWQFGTNGIVNSDLQKAADILYQAEPSSSFDGSGNLLPGSCWFALSFLTLDFPFALEGKVLSVGYEGSERLPIYRHLQQGTFVKDIMWEVKDQFNRMTSP